MSQYSWAQPSARRPPAARGGSVITEPRGARRPPARKHAAGPGTGKSGGEPQRPQPRHAPALEPPQAARLPPRLSQGPAVSSPPRESHSVSFAGPALGEAPASGPWGFRHHGTSRRQTPTSAQARRRAGNGEERGRTPAPATPPRSRSGAPTSRTASPPPQPGARGLVAPQIIPQRKHCGPSPRRGARQRPVGVPSSRNLEAPDAHQRASTPQGRERGRAGANPSARNPATLPLWSPHKPHGFPPASARGPRSRRPPDHPTAKALRAQPSARRPPAARGGSVITEPRGARRPPARKHAAGPGTGKSGGEPQRPQPRHAPALEPPASRGAYARLSQGPMVCYSRRALPAGRGAHRATRPAPSPGSPL